MPAPTELIWWLHLAATCAMAGILWLVQLVIYPLFAVVGRAEFPNYHRRYTARISWVVGPLMALEVVTAAWLWLDGLRAGWFLGALGLLAVVWISTAFWQVPLHRRLEKGFVAEAHQQLVASNWLRTIAWTLRTGILIGLSL